MKTKLLSSILGLAIAALPQFMEAQTVLNPEANDATVSAAVMADTHFEMFGGNRTITHQNGGSAGVMPFKLPAIPAGKAVESASLKIYISTSGSSFWIDGPINNDLSEDDVYAQMDLYGLPFRTVNEITLADYYAGDFQATEGSNTGIQEDLFHKNVPVGTKDAARWEETTEGGNAALVAYINAQLLAGAVEGDFIYLRMSPNGELSPDTSLPAGGFANLAFWAVDAHNGTNPPELTIKFEGDDVGGPVYGASEDNGVYGNVTSENVTYPAPDLDPWSTRPNHYLGGLKQFEEGVDAALLANYDGAAVIPFLLPALPADKVVSDVDFSVFLEGFSAWGVLNCDLYGIDARPTAVVLASDFFAGAYDTDGSATAIQDDFILHSAAVVGPLAANTSGKDALKTFLQQQYDNGKAGQYVFLRINPDVVNVTTYLRHQISSADHATDANKPQMSITFDDALSTESFERGALSIYPNPVTDGRLSVSLDGFSNNAKLNIYAITGQLVHSEKVEVNSRNIFKTSLNLNSGLYVVKLQDGNISKTQKLIIK